MLLESYRKEIVRPECNPSFQSLHCLVHLDQDVGEALPYLNAVLGGFEYIDEPPSVTFRTQGKIITVHPRLIAINALKDEAEADKIIDWLRREINQAWENRDDIEPRYTGMPRPQVLEILKTLPKTNCKKCGQPTCMVFAVQAAEGAKGSANCPEMTIKMAEQLDKYLIDFFPETEF